MKASAAAFGVCLGLALSQSAQADVLKFLSNANSQNFNATKDLVLNEETNATVVTFKKKGEAGLVVVRFTAECLTQGNNGSWASVTISIRPDGESAFTPLAPTSNDQSLCAPGNNNGAYWVSATAVGGVEVPVGKHALKVTIRPNGTTSNIRIDDLTLTVEE